MSSLGLVPHTTDGFINGGILRVALSVRLILADIFSVKIFHHAKDNLCVADEPFTFIGFSKPEKFSLPRTNNFRVMAECDRLIL